MKFLLAALALAAAACGQGDASASREAGPSADSPSAPAPIELTGRVVDRANILDAPAEEMLTRKLAELEAQTSDQMVVVTVPSLAGETIEKYSLDLANRWQIGRADLNNGVLLVVAPNERNVRIEVGLGLEGLLTDADAAKILQLMFPSFRQGKLQDGVTVGVDAVDRVLRSDVRRPQPKPSETKEAA